jgi:hypothetical protein
MRVKDDTLPMSPEWMVPERHPARRIEKRADECLAAMS